MGHGPTIYLYLFPKSLTGSAMPGAPSGQCEKAKRKQRETAGEHYQRGGFGSVKAIQSRRTAPYCDRVIRVSGAIVGPIEIPLAGRV